jgi:glutamine cyclotransferase
MRYLLLILVICLSIGCTNTPTQQESNIITLLPEAGTVFKAGDSIRVEFKDTTHFKSDSVVYLIDGQHYLSKANPSEVIVNTSQLLMGSRLLSARIYHQGNFEEYNTNFIVLPAKAPDQLTYQIVRTYPHDVGAYTQGLEYFEGFFYESVGEYGSSDLRKVELSTGKVLAQVKLTDQQFAEGIALVGDKIVQLTWREGIGLVYNRSDLKLEGNFAYQASREGWGLCFDGRQLWKSDGTNRIWKLNKDTFREEGYIEVYNYEGQVTELNELEYIDGKIYANIYQADKIVVIDPQSGVVTAEIDMTGLLPDKDYTPDTDVLNGIAWDAKGKRLFVTGKKWNKIFEIKIVPSK